MKTNEIYNIKNRLSLKECGLRLKECREAKHLTQVELADLIGVVPQQISNYETGKRGFANNAVLLGNTLNVSPQYLLGYTDFKSISDEIDADCKHISHCDDMLVQLLRLMGYGISFETAAGEQTTETPEHICIIGFCGGKFCAANDTSTTVVIDEQRIDLLDFQYMLDDIRDYIDFILNKTLQYQERRCTCIAIDSAREAEKKEKIGKERLLQLIADGKLKAEIE